MNCLNQSDDKQEDVVDPAAADVYSLKGSDREFSMFYNTYYITTRCTIINIVL